MNKLEKNINLFMRLLEVLQEGEIVANRAEFQKEKEKLIFSFHEY
jgi:hypothetical protein